ncbi:MAG: toll/interleukin-1 receptor domain-containing protein, partial [Rhizobiales bacterium]|nr:toll/interleukin-1 receptor domain-containing protein [Hyphomicrobiales bacterium]
MPAIFISYRREDSRAVTRALASELAARFGDDMIFLDVDAIEAGVDFSQTILDALRAASVVLVIIGPRWLTSTGDLADSRLPEPNDFVRLEIETAQQWG